MMFGIAIPRVLLNLIVISRSFEVFVTHAGILFSLLRWFDFSGNEQIVQTTARLVQ